MNHTQEQRIPVVAIDPATSTLIELLHQRAPSLSTPHAAVPGVPTRRGAGHSRGHYCSAPAVHESAIGLAWDVMNEAPAKEHRCEECQAEFVRTAKREQRLAEEGWI